VKYIKIEVLESNQLNTYAFKVYEKPHEYYRMDIFSHKNREGLIIVSCRSNRASYKDCFKALSKVRIYEDCLKGLPYVARYIRSNKKLMNLIPD